MVIRQQVIKDAEIETDYRKSGSLCFFKSVMGNFCKGWFGLCGWGVALVATLCVVEWRGVEGSRAYPKIIRKEIDSILNPEALVQELQVCVCVSSHTERVQQS